MLSCEDYVIAHCKRIYGMQILYKNRKVYIRTDSDIYWLDLSGADENVFRFCGEETGYELRESCLPRGFFKIAARKTYEKAGIGIINEDWEQFLNDAYRIEIEL